MNRLKHLNEKGIYSPLWWYADYPENVVGDAGYATEEKGKALMDICVKALVRTIKTIKEDTEAPRLQAEFTQRVLNKGK